MKEIIINCLTEKGAEAYRLIDAEGEKQSWKDKKIAKALAEDEILSLNPLVVKVRVKIEWLAVQVRLDEQTVLAMEKKGAVKDKDFNVVVKWK
jgi:hypothetical protein